MEGAMPNDTKSSKLDIAFKVTFKVKNKAQIVTMRLTLKAMSNWDDFDVIDRAPSIL